MTRRVETVRQGAEADDLPSPPAGPVSTAGRNQRMGRPQQRRDQRRETAVGNDPRARSCRREQIHVRMVAGCNHLCPGRQRRRTETDTGEVAQVPAGNPPDVAAEQPAAVSRNETEQDGSQQFGGKKHPEPPRAEQLPEGDGSRAEPVVAAPHQPSVDERRDDIGHQHDGEHADDGHFGQRPHGRVARDDERSDADEHDQRRDHDAAFVRGQQLAPVGVFVDKSFGDEDRIVVALAEDEGGQDDVHDVEPDVEQLHEAEDPQPADSHGQEGHEAQFEPPEREPEEEEDDHTARPADVVEVAGQ